MSGVRGVLAGSLGLIALQAVVSSAQSASRTGQLATDIASIIDRTVNPAVPLIPDLRKSSTARSSSSTGGSVVPASSTGTASLSAAQFNPRQAPLPRPATTPLPVIAGPGS